MILGDRTGETVSGVFQQVLSEAAAQNPSFVVTVGDSIQGSADANAQTEWREVELLLKPYRRFPIYLAAGNHDIWSAASEQLFREHAGHAPNYSFDSGPVHCTVLDNSRSDAFPPEAIRFLEEDLKAHAAQPVKFIVSHRPSWLMNVALRDPDFAVHRLARQYGVQYVIAGHLHQMLHFTFDGVTYISMPSAGGHLRASQKYEDGWFFGHALVEVQGPAIKVQIEEAKAPHGEGRVTALDAWGMTGLISKHTKE